MMQQTESTTCDQHQHQQYHAARQPADEIHTLWIGNLQHWMDESYISTCFAHEVVNVRLIRNNQTGQLEDYGFIDFLTRAGAERALQQYNRTNVEQNFRLNWASFGAGEKRGDDDDTPDFTILVGDLGPDVTDYILQETFKSHYTSIKGAKVVIDRLTGRPKGCGFVRFGDEREQQRAMTEMKGVYCSSQPMRIGVAANEIATSSQQQYPKVPKGLEMAMTEQIISEPYRMEIDDSSDPGKLECRICLEDLHEENQIAIKSARLCKDAIGVAHRDCAEEWFKKKCRGADRVCEVCGTEAKNVVHPWDVPAFSTEMASSPTPIPSETIIGLIGLSRHRVLRLFITCTSVVIIIVGLRYFI